jgi:hypothetical protein
MLRRLPDLVRALAARIVDSLRYLAFRVARYRALRKAKREDPNIYPLW